MRALIIDNFPASKFRSADIPKPEPKAGEVLVRIYASGVNPIDCKIRKGLAPYAKAVLPAILGADLAGTIETIGSNVQNFKVGDEVYGMTGGLNGLQGSLAEFAAVDHRLLAKKPSNLTMREAAAIPLSFLTAWEGLVDRAKLSPGQKVLILGGSGGVGHMAIQIAKALGANVFATASGAKLDMVKQLGATPFDYHSTTLEQISQVCTNGEGFDVIYDTVGGPSLDEAFKVLRNYGNIVSCLGYGNHDLKNLCLHAGIFSGIFVLLPLLTDSGRERLGDSLTKATKLAEAGHLRPIVDPRHFTLDSAYDAQAAVEEGQASVKIVIDVTGK